MGMFSQTRTRSLVPVGNVLVGDAGGHIEHDDAALALDVVAITETAKLFLTSRVPGVEADGTVVGVEHQGMHLHTHRRNILFLKLTGQVSLHKGRLAGPAVAHQDEFEGGNLFCAHALNSVESLGMDG